jgi:hypothetical protein
MMWHPLAWERNPVIFEMGMAGIHLALGACLFFCALKDHDWIVTHKKLSVHLIVGRGGARIFWMLLGLVIMGAGMLGGWYSLLGR